MLHSRVRGQAHILVGETQVLIRVLWCKRCWEGDPYQVEWGHRRLRCILSGSKGSARVAKEGVFFCQSEKGHSWKRDKQAKTEDENSQMHWRNCTRSRRSWFYYPQSPGTWSK